MSPTPIRKRHTLHWTHHVEKDGSLSYWANRDSFCFHVFYSPVKEHVELVAWDREDVDQPLVHVCHSFTKNKSEFLRDLPAYKRAVIRETISALSMKLEEAKRILFHD